MRKAISQFTSQTKSFLKWVWFSLSAPLSKGGLRGFAVFRRFVYHPHIKKITTHIWRNRIAWGIISVVIFIGSFSYFYSHFPQTALAATYTFTQTDWSGGADTGATAVHPTNSTGWDKYYNHGGLIPGVSVGLDSTVESLSGRIETSNNWASSIQNMRMVSGTTPGVLHVLYVSTEYKINITNIAYRKSVDGGITWSERVDVTSNTVRNSNYSDLAIDKDGNLHVVYQSYEYNATYPNIAYRKSTDGGATWSSKVDVTTATTNINVVWPYITVDNSNNIHLSYTSRERSLSYSSIAYRKSINGGSTWSSRVDITTSSASCYYGRILAEDENTLHFAYFSQELTTGNGYYNVAYRKSLDGGNTWSGRVDISTSTTGSAQDADMIMDGSGNIYIAYETRKYTANYDNIDIRKSTDGGTSWGEAVRVTTSTSASNFDLKMVLDNNNYLHVIYTSTESLANTGNTAHRLSTDGGTTWSGRHDVTTGTYNKNYPIILFDGTNNKLYTAHISLEFSLNYANIAFRESTNDGATWSSRVDITDIYNKSSYIPSIAINTSTGAICVVYYSTEHSPSYSTVVSRYSNDGGITWSPVVDITAGDVQSDYPKIVIDNSGTIHLVYVSKEYNATYDNIVYRKSLDGGATWSDKVYVTQNTNRSSDYPEIAVDNAGNLHVVYSSYEYNQTYGNIAYRRSTDGGVTWSSRVDITATSRHNYYPKIAIGTNGDVRVVYFSYEYNASIGNIAFRNSTDGGITWSARVDVTNNSVAHANNPDLFIDNNDTTHIVYTSWEFNASYYNVAYKKSLDGGINWSNRVDVTTNTARNSDSPKIVVDDTGILCYVVYDSYEYDSSDRNIALRKSTNIGETWSSRVNVTTGTVLTSFKVDVDKNSAGELKIVYHGEQLDGNILNISLNTFIPSLYLPFGSLLSTKYNSSDNANVIGGVSWKEDASLPTGTTVTTSIRTASTEGGLDTAEWLDFTNASSTCSKNGTTGVVTCPVSSIPSYMKDGTGDNWIQYKIGLGSTGANTPTVDDVVITYVVNAPPEAQNVTAVPNADGTVTIGYDVRDTDGNTGSTHANFVSTTFEYYNSANNSWNTITTIAGSIGGEMLDAVQTSAYNPYSVTWTPVTDAPGVYATSSLIRVTVNDGEAANYSDTANSASFILDTTAPSGVSLVINATTIPAVLYLTVSDDSAVEMKVGLASDLSGASWEAYSTAKNITLVSDPDIVYAQFKDAYGNTSSISSVTTPSTPSSAMIQDTSNVDFQPPDLRLFLAWRAVTDGDFASYNIYRSTDGVTWTLLVDITDINTNFYTDTSVSSEVLYYYRLTHTNTAGSVSYPASFSSGNLTAKANGTQDYGEGGGGGAAGATPDITGISTSNLTPSSVLITWDTSVLSNSSIGYSTTPGDFDDYTTTVSSMVDNNASIGNHQVALTSLSPNTTYYYKATSANVIGISASSTCGDPNGCSFTTLNGTTISGVSNPEVTNTSAKIVWNTSDTASSYVVYSTSSNFTYSLTSGSADLLTSHEVVLSDLIQATRYYYYVKSINGSAVESTDKNIINGVVNYYSFNTTNDTEYPLITNVRTLPSTTSTEITWETNEMSDTQVEYGSTSNYTASTTRDTTKTIKHATTITGLTAGTLYHFRVQSEDQNGYRTNSADYTFTTTAEPTEGETIYVTRILTAETDDMPPNIYGLKVLNIAQNQATIKWTTDEQSNSLVRYGYNSAYTKLNGYDNEYLTNHEVTLKDLTPNTTYHFQAVSYDASGNAAESEDTVFKTLKEGETPVVSGEVTVSEDKEKIIEGLTEEQSRVLTSVRQASEKFLLRIFEELKNNPKLSTIPESTFIQAITEMTDKVVEAPTIVGIRPVVEVQGTTAIVKWVTDKKTNSMVLFAGSKEYKPDTKDPYTQSAINPEEFDTTHKVELANLEPATTYHFQVRSKGLVGPEASSKDYTFITGSELPKITDISISKTAEGHTNIFWKTNLATAATLEYTNLTTRQTLTQGDATLLLVHNMILKNLDPGAAYSLVIKARDEFNNEVSSLPIRFSTTVDSVAPVISKLTSDSTLYPGQESKVQTIISWETNEPATSQVFYQEGINDTGKVIAMPIDTSMVLRHIVVITKFKPGTVYKYWVESQDSSGNVTKSDSFSVLSPQEKETIIDVIINNFEQVFGWTKKIGK